jgi:hypothetical protein
MTIAEIFRQYGPAYVEQFGECMPAEHDKVIDAIIHCRTPQAGVAVFGCEKCPGKQLVYLGCGNRHCPNCQHDKSRKWLDRAMRNVLPGPHFMITFTVPEELRRVFRGHQKVAYTALFKASSEALKGALANPKYCGTDLPGFFGVLHTWTRQLEYHPHIHYVVPGGGLDRATGLWRSTANNYCVPTRVLSTLIKAKFRDAMTRAGLYQTIPSQVWRRDWVVDSQAVGSNTQGVLKYLAPYTFRVAISDSRIVAVKDDKVTFTYTPSGTSKTKLCTLRVFEFMRRFLQHVLPRGFMKIRYYGFMGSGCRIPHPEIAAMVQLANAESPIFTIPEPPSPPAPRPPMQCPCCGDGMKLWQIWKNHYLVYDAVTAALRRVARQ